MLFSCFLVGKRVVIRSIVLFLFGGVKRVDFDCYRFLMGGLRIKLAIFPGRG